MSSEWHEELLSHDQQLLRHDLHIWVGGEPTFTRRESVAPEWTSSPLGGDKQERARALLLELRARLAPGAACGRAEGRSYGGEPEPRFAFAMRWRRGESSESALPPDAIEALLEPPAPGPDACWLTVTPDPGVVEVNLHPCPDIMSYWRALHACYESAAAVGLSAHRHLYNGRRVDSGGGGQITFGGPSPEQSPFFRHPMLLASLVRYLNAHPALSYWFASECVGSASQGPRPDEGVRELFGELCLALEHLPDDASPTLLQQCLGPLLVDASGNSHRAEVNIEKLWNPEHPRQGQLGAVELRALAMPPTAEHGAAVAMLFRSLLARLCVAPFREPPKDWGAELHDRFALPSVLRDDLDTVLADLDAHGFGLGPAAQRRVRERGEPLIETTLGAATLTISRALEFWPLFGDVASQEQRSSRLVDASTESLELLEHGGDHPGSLVVDGRGVPLRPLPSGARVAGVRYRVYRPQPGFHPTLSALEPVEVDWYQAGQWRRITLHAWQPAGGAYAGLPSSNAEAQARSAARVRVGAAAPRPAPPPTAASGCWRVDLRRPAPRE